MNDYVTKTIAPGALMDGGDPNNFAFALYRPPVWTNGADLWFNRFAVQHGIILNRTGGAISAGLASRIHKTLWRAGQLNNAGAYTDDTVDAQDVGTNDFALEVINDNNTGFLVACQYPFNALSILVSTTGSGGSPVHTL